ncbi:MAG: hypothetical protein K0Q71_797 [Thermomicrobiales bacterium]|jgi:hypothetical protein|nr:hypothetical protein [Thermomicrobiales bacterium]
MAQRTQSVSFWASANLRNLGSPDSGFGSAEMFRFAHHDIVAWSVHGGSDGRAATCNPDLRRLLRLLNANGASGPGARPRPPRDGGALSEAGSPGGLRLDGAAVRASRVGRDDHASSQALSRSRGDQRRALGGAGNPVAPTALSATGYPPRPGRRVRLDCRESQPIPGHHPILRGVPRPVPLTAILTNQAHHPCHSEERGTSASRERSFLRAEIPCCRSE